MSKAESINVASSFDSLLRLQNRTPSTTDDESKDSFKMLSQFRDGGVFVSTFAGVSEWERHPTGDEMVMAVEGRTDLTLLVDGIEKTNTLSTGDLIVIPQNTWHRFTTSGVKILSVTPQPTHHSSDVVPSD